MNKFSKPSPVAGELNNTESEKQEANFRAAMTRHHAEWETVYPKRTVDLYRHMFVEGVREGINSLTNATHYHPTILTKEELQAKIKAGTYIGPVVHHDGLGNVFVGNLECVPSNPEGTVDVFPTQKA